MLDPSQNTVRSAGTNQNLFVCMWQLFVGSQVVHGRSEHLTRLNRFFQDLCLY